jgi:hypothetical protein
MDRQLQTALEGALLFVCMCVLYLSLNGCVKWAVKGSSEGEITSVPFTDIPTARV